MGQLLVFGIFRYQYSKRNALPCSYLPVRPVDDTCKRIIGRSLLICRYLYACKTTSDDTNRYLFGWVPTKDGSTDAGGKDYAGNMSSHLLTQNADGTLSVGVPAAIEKAFYKENEVTATAKSSDETTSGLDYQLTSPGDTSYALFGKMKTSCIIKTTVSFSQTPQNFGFLLGTSSVSSQTYQLGFQNGNAQSVFVNGGAASTDATLPFALTAGTNYSLEVVVENSIATMYINGVAALTTRVYSMQNAPWGVYTVSGTATFKNLTVYTLK
jgi:beta-fructofuranosidase